VQYAEFSKIDAYSTLVAFIRNSFASKGILLNPA